jgi:hypothetical protein
MIFFPSGLTVDVYEYVGTQCVTPGNAATIALIIVVNPAVAAVSAALIHVSSPGLKAPDSNPGR